MDTSGINRGYLNFLDNSTRRAAANQQIDINRMAIEDALTRRGDEQLAGALIRRLRANPGGGMMLPQAPATAQAPMPGQQSMPAQPPVGTGTVLAPQQEQGPGPYLSYEDAVAQSKQPQLPAAPAPTAAPERALPLFNIIKLLNEQQVPDDRVFGVLKVLEPLMSAENRAEVAALNSQVNLMRAQQKLETDQLRADIRDREFEWKKEYQSERLRGAEEDRERKAQSLSERMRAAQIRNDLEERKLGRLVKNDDQRVAFNQVRARNEQMKAIGAELPSLMQVAINGTSAQRAQAAARIAVIEAEYDRMLTQYSKETNAFLDAVDDAAAATPAAEKPAGATPAASGGAAKPPKPTDPGYEYRFDDKRNVWQRKPKQ